MKKSPKKQAPPIRRHLDKRAANLAVAGDGHDDDLLSSNDLAVWLGVSLQFVETARHQNRGPKYSRLSSRLIRYRRGDVRAWLLERAHNGTSEYTA